MTTSPPQQTEPTADQTDDEEEEDYERPPMPLEESQDRRAWLFYSLTSE